MDPKNRGSQEHGHDEGAPGGASGAPHAAGGPGDGSSPRPPAQTGASGLPGPTGDVPTPPLGAPVPGASASPPSSASAASAASSALASTSPARTARIVAGEYLLTVNPVDGSEIEPCPPGERRARPERHGPDERAELRRAAAAPRPSGTVLPELPMLERDEERERLARLLARGRSVRVTGPSGAGRSTLLEAVASDCERLAPDGVVRLSGYHRTPTDLLHDLYAAVLSAPLHRPDRAELLAAVREIGAVVVLDDIEFGGAALDEFLDATPECAFLLSATPEVPAPSPDSHLEEVFLSGLSRTAGLELLERAARRPLAEEEASWAADLWFESEGLPLRFVQAGALLRQRDARHDDPSAPEDRIPLPSIAEAASPAALLAARLGEAARDALRFAVALGGECPHQAHLPALSGDAHADTALGELLGCGLVTPAGSHYRLAARVTAQLEEAGYADEGAGRAHTVAQHYAWWAGHPSVAPERVAAEADAILAAMAALIGSREAGHADAAVLLARAAAPALAAALHWGAWERAVRHGQEAARLAGQVADEAYFHHELGVLALCTGHLDRARAELEASIGLRGVLADKQGTVAGRRALALVADRSTGSAMAGAFGTGGGPSGGNRKGDTGRPAAGGAPDDTAATIVTPKAATTTPMAAMGSTAATTAATAALPSASRTSVAAPATSTAPTADSAPAGPSGGKPGGLRRLALHGARRNVVAAASGVLLVGALGTVVTLGVTSGDDSGGPGDKVKPDRSASQQDDDKGLTADEPTSSTSQAPEPGPSGSSKTSASPTEPSDSGSPSGSTEPSGPSSTSNPPSDTERPPSPPSSHPTPSHPRPTTKPPTSKPPTPTDEPSEPTPTTSSPTTTPTGGTSTTASAPATPTPSSTATPVV
ncbi:AAA family ATPase [Streptomyces antioxidans]|uniref:AAA family ATPase n=1 Tax=Streptomyces antioxidans TaxID=1507734 RepID=A0A1V4D7J7_9ACTN|nr:ATP-binding protein [Streptomyces antioxidans]OPF80547.1 AAA family ATPase [Streptomyces antioxidans]